jgi:hypothetical protein
MSLTVELSKVEEAQLDAAARMEGVPREELARKVIVDHLCPPADKVVPAGVRPRVKTGHPKPFRLKAEVAPGMERAVDQVSLDRA